MYVIKYNLIQSKPKLSNLACCIVVPTLHLTVLFANVELTVNLTVIDAFQLRYNRRSRWDLPALIVLIGTTTLCALRAIASIL